MNKVITNIIKSRLLGIGVLTGLLVGVSGALAFASAPVRAADTSMTISPPKQELKLNPGDDYTGSFTVLNGGQEDYQFKVYATPFQLDSAYQNDFSSENQWTQISRWLTFDREVYTATAGEQVAVSYQIKVPRDVPAGGQYASIMAEILPETDIGGVQAIKRVAMLLISQVAGKTVEAGTFTAGAERSWYSHGPITFTGEVTNSGNTDFRVLADLTVTKFFGRKNVYTSEPLDLFLFPANSRPIEFQWEQPRVGLFWVAGKVEFLDKVENESRLVLVAPVWLLLLGALLVTTIVFVIFNYWWTQRAQPTKSGKASTRLSRRLSRD
jgi:hypothetical protein